MCPTYIADDNDNIDDRVVAQPDTHKPGCANKTLSPLPDLGGTLTR
jgi:hypothetical protein